MGTKDSLDKQAAWEGVVVVYPEDDRVLTGEELYVFNAKQKCYEWFCEHVDDMPEYLAEAFRIGGPLAQSRGHIEVLRDMVREYYQHKEIGGTHGNKSQDQRGTDSSSPA